VRGQVFYESFSGNGMLDHPEAIFQELLAAPDMQHLTHVWALTDLERYAGTVDRYRGDPRVHFVVYGSASYFEALARSEYLVNNATFPPQFGKRDGQVYVNTWHGTPMKQMGYDVPGGGPATRNVIRNFLSADFLVSSSEFMTRQMYETAYKLRGIYRGQVIQEGSPRVDRQFLNATECADLRRQLVSRGVELNSGEQIVLYAPTWKGSFYSPVNDVKQLLYRVRSLNQCIDTSRYRVLLKVHQRVFDFAVGEPELRNLLIPNDIPTNSMLAVTDVLVTDYSSIFFDMLATGRPMLFFMPDEAHYADTRGLYVPTSAWPGPVSHTLEELADHLTSIGTGAANDPLVTHAKAYSASRAEYCPKEDGSATRRVVNVVFRGRADGYDVRDMSDGRTSILIYLGGMLNNGITTSGLNLLNNIDHNRFDVSVCYNYRKRKYLERNETLVNPRVRLLPRVGGINGSKVFRFGRQAMLTRGAHAGSALQRRIQARLFHDEWVRCFGMSRFDHIVDFSGYGPFWDYVLLRGEAKTHSIWLHNDLLADSQREVKGRKPLERGLRSVFSTYHLFDNLVSVSPALAEINREKLSEYASADRFVSAVNTIDHATILRRAYGATLDDASVPADGRREVTVDVGNLAAAIDVLAKHYALDVIRDEVHRQRTVASLVPAAPGLATFVTAGRLSPEKNHARLIRAFDQVHREFPATHLLIMGGGPLAKELKALVVELGLVTAVTLTGSQANPYAVMANADCFVLSSDYEGQPMVLLEAMVLGMPIVSTNFASVRGALPEGQGLVVDRSDDALAEGMEAYLRGDVPVRAFDYVEYNRDAMEQFYAAIGATTTHGEHSDGSAR
jgi:CDP-glycerol glycerophosphotransferase